MSERPFKRRAEEFLVWRERQRLNGKCTYAALAIECGLSVDRVEYICRKRDWKCRAESDVYGEINYSNAHQMDDLVDLMN